MAKRHYSDIKEDFEKNDENMKHVFKAFDQGELQNRLILKAKRRLINKESIELNPFANFTGFNLSRKSINHSSFFKITNHSNDIRDVHLLEYEDEQPEKDNITLDARKIASPFATFHGFGQSFSNRSPSSFFKTSAQEINSSAAITSKGQSEKESDDNRMDEGEENMSELKVTEVDGDNLKNLNKKFRVSMNLYGDFTTVQSLEKPNLMYHDNKANSTHYEQNSFLLGSTFTAQDLSSNNYNDTHHHINFGKFNSIFNHEKANAVSHDQKSFPPGSKFTMEDLSLNNAKDAQHRFNFANNLEKDCRMNFVSNFTNNSSFNARVINIPTAIPSTSSQIVSNLTDEPVSEKKPVQFSPRSFLEPYKFSFGCENQQGTSLISNDYQKSSQTPNFMNHQKTNNNVSHEQKSFFPGSKLTTEDHSSNNTRDVQHCFNFGNNLEREKHIDREMDFVSNHTSTSPFNFQIVDTDTPTATSSTSSELISNLIDESAQKTELVQFPSRDNIEQKISHGTTSLKFYPHVFSFLPLPLRADLLRIFTPENN